MGRERERRRLGDQDAWPSNAACWHAGFTVMLHLRVCATDSDSSVQKMDLLVRVSVLGRTTTNAVSNTCTERTVSTSVARFSKKLNRCRFIVSSLKLVEITALQTGACKVAGHFLVCGR